MKWKKERPLIGTEGLTKVLQPIFSTPNLVTQQISFESGLRERIVDRQTVAKPIVEDIPKRSVPEELKRENI